MRIIENGFVTVVNWIGIRFKYKKIYLSPYKQHLKYGCNMEKSICNRRDQVKNTDEGAISLFLTVPASIKSGFEAKNLICNRRGMLAGGRTHSHVLIKLKNLCNEIILFRIYGHKGGEGEDAKFPPGCVRSRNISGIRNWRGAGGKAPVN